jgi:hypothetical protein
MPTSAMYFSLATGAMRDSALEKIAQSRNPPRPPDAGRAEQGEADQWQQDGIKAGDDRRPGDARVAQAPAARSSRPA